MAQCTGSLMAAPSLNGAAIRSRPSARSARLARPPVRRTAARPVAAVDPATAAMWTAQAQEFGLTLMGAGFVTALASVTAHALRAAAATVTPAPVRADAPLRPVARPVAAPLAAAAPAAQQQPAVAAQAILEIGDIKSQLQQSADEAVAAVKTALSAEPAAKPAAAAAKPAPAPNGAAVKPGMTVEEATQQVKDWITAWRGEGSEPAATQPAGTSFAEPTPADAAAVLDALTADAPVGATPMGADAPITTGAAAPSVEEQVLAAVASVAPADAPPSPADEAAAAEREQEYKARIAAVVADSKLGAALQQGTAEERARAERVADRIQKRVVQVGPEYQAKIESLWQKYESKKEEEAALLQKSQQILESLAESEAAERQQLVEAMAAASAAAAPAPAQRQQEQGALQALFARIAALFQALQRWVQQLVSSLTGGSGSGAGASA